MVIVERARAHNQTTTDTGMATTTLIAANAAPRKGRPRRAQELADFLRVRRARIAPEEAGFIRGRRRTSGLRREEVAQLAGYVANAVTIQRSAK